MRSFYLAHLDEPSRCIKLRVERSINGTDDEDCLPSRGAGRIQDSDATVTPAGKQSKNRGTPGDQDCVKRMGNEEVVIFPKSPETAQPSAFCRLIPRE